MIQVSVEGVPEVEKLLANWQEPALTKRAQHATKQGAKVLKAPLADAVRPLSKRMAASVYIHVAKRDRPAYVVGHHKRIAFFWHFLIGGTKAHSTSARNGSRRGPFVSGIEAHPVVAAVARDYADQAYRAIVDDLVKNLPPSADS